MKISYKWLKDYIPTDLNPETVSELLTSTGLEVEGLESYESLEGGLKGVVSGLVLTCEKHPDADKLSVTTVDVGTGEPLSIVCGAPNVRAGQKVLVATVGTDLPDGNGGTFTIKKSKIRGEVSEGMICAEDELGLGDSHDGIMVLDEQVTIGLDAADIFEIYRDQIFEIGLTPNRSDANGHIGVARDLMAVMRVHHGSALGLNYPDTSQFVHSTDPPPIEVEVRNQEACPRYCGLTLKNIQVKDSPKWLKDRLEAIGQRSLNNVVDITNFILHEYGQPLHAFDADKINGQRVVVATLENDRSFQSLDEVERKLDAEDLMICDGELNPMCMAGVFGGIASGVTKTTNRIFLESAHFSPTGIRRSSTRHQLRTDAARCFEKGTDPNICVEALKRAALLLQEYAGAEVEGSIIDVYPHPIEEATVRLSTKYFNNITGLSLQGEEIAHILWILEMKNKLEGDEIIIQVPTNKPDVTRPADIVEEVLRIYGLDNVPVSNKFTFSASIKDQPDANELKDKLSDFLSSRGFNEMMAMSITQSGYFKEAMPIPEDQLVYINNTSNVHFDIMRPDLLISGLEAVAYNLNRKQNRLRLFEFGSSYLKVNEDYKEQESLSIILTGDRYGLDWRNTQSGKYDFYDIKSEVGLVLERLGLDQWQTEEISDHRFSYGVRYFRGPMSIVSFGKVQPVILKELGIKQDVFAAVFDWKLVFKAIKKNRVYVQEISKFPEVSRDLALVIDKKVSFAEVELLALKTEKKILNRVQLFDVYENTAQLGEDKKSYAINFTLASSERTLSEKDIEGAMERLIKAFENQLEATIRK